MITFFMTLLAHCFGRRPVDEVIWVMAMMVGMLELAITGMAIGELLK